MPDRYMSTGVVTVVLSPDRFLLPLGTKDRGGLATGWEGPELPHPSKSGQGGAPGRNFTLAVAARPA